MRLLILDLTKKIHKDLDKIMDRLTQDIISDLVKPHKIIDSCMGLFYDHKTQHDQ